MSSSKPERRPVPRLPRGFRDTFAADVVFRQRMIDTIREVYERYGFAPLETPAVEYVEALGKFLPESSTPAGGIFAFQEEDNSWLALRYDLTAPLSRIFAEHRHEIPLPFRRYQIGLVWRNEKPGPGRFREFYQFDIDTVGSASMAGDAEVCCAVADAL
ncbi:MAG: ATP phosphoribosyltransferase regulatory subunit, partial [Acidobacteriota bacterium]